MKRILSFFAAIALLASAMPVQAATLSSGDLIKASGQAVYYYGADGKRYVFPTEKTYKSWYADFSGVKTITDNELAAITIGGNVTYKPGVRMVKVTTDPRVYAVDGKQLRWVQDEATAKTIFGDDWAKQVDDIPDAFFVNYTIGASIDNAADYAPASVRSSYTTIQATIDAAAPTPAPTPTPTPTPNPTPTPTSTASLAVTLTPDKTQAQPNEQVFVIAQTTTTSSIDRLELYADDGLMTTCHAMSCSGTWTIPTVNVKDSYVFRAKLIMSDGRTVEDTKTVTIASAPVNPNLQVTASRSTIRPDEVAHIRAIAGQNLSSSRTDIYVDGSIMKSCSTASTANDCKYDNYISGSIGSTHQVYAMVRTQQNLYYKSNTITITLGNNDSPTLSLVAGNADIYTGESVDITATAQDDDGVNQVQISKDGAVLKTCTGAVPCTITTGPWTTAGTLTFQALATDLVGTTSTAVTTVNVH